MDIAFKLKSDDFEYRTGGVYEPTHLFSLVNQTIQVNKTSNFTKRFPNIWEGYKLPKITDIEVYNNWLSNPMQFWQNQLNFAVWASTTGCGVSKYHLQHKNPMIRSFYRFHVYYQIRRILREMGCPLPFSDMWKPLNNNIDKMEYEKICNEFGINTNSNFRQKLDNLNGMGDVFYTRTYSVRRKEKAETDYFDPKDGFKVKWTHNNKGKQCHHMDKIDYIEQSFHKQSDTADYSSDGRPMSAIGSFIVDNGRGITRPGIPRINDSIRTFVWAILGTQPQIRASIVSGGKALEAQKQFLVNVEQAINSAINVPDSIKRYEDTLGYARSKLDFLVSYETYLIPSDMDLYIGKLNGYNNLLKDASESITPLKLGYNPEVNDLPPTPVYHGELQDEKLTLQDSVLATPVKLDTSQGNLTHDENKLLLTLAGITIGTLLIWYV